MTCMYASLVCVIAISEASLFQQGCHPNCNECFISLLPPPSLSSLGSASWCSFWMALVSTQAFLPQAAGWSTTKGSCWSPPSLSHGSKEGASFLQQWPSWCGPLQVGLLWDYGALHRDADWHLLWASCVTLWDSHICEGKDPEAWRYHPLLKVALLVFCLLHFNDCLSLISVTLRRKYWLLPQCAC